MELKKRVLITGSNGLVGSTIKNICDNYNYHFYFKSRKELDITIYEKIKEFLLINKINIVINCAAFTNVNKAEKRRKLANEINNKAVNQLAKICSDLKVQLIHISTDYVFDGKKRIPYKENDKANPINFYGITKLEGEKSIMRHNLKKSLIIRTSWLYAFSNKNFVTEILKKINNNLEIFVTVNEFGSPTNAFDLAHTILNILPKIKNNKTEIYHYSNDGYCSRYEFAQKIKEIIQGKSKLTALDTTDSNILRPKFSALDSNKICDIFGIKLMNWEVSLEEHLKNKNIYNEI